MTRESILLVITVPEAEREGKLNCSELEREVRTNIVATEYRQLFLEDCL